MLSRRLSALTLTCAALAVAMSASAQGVADAQASGQKREGELTVSLTDSDDVVLTRMVFSFGVDDDGVATALIGGVQGLDAGIDKRVIVKATRALSGLRPKDATPTHKASFPVWRIGSFCQTSFCCPPTDALARASGCCP